MSYSLITYPEYLEHYGIKGQRWGVRRFQNPDGSLTAAGKEHYSVGSRADRAFNKQYNKLVKLKKNADLGAVMDEWEHHDQKAKKAGRVAAAGASTAALGATIAGYGQVNRSRLNKIGITTKKMDNGSWYVTKYPMIGSNIQLAGLGIAAGGAAVAIGALGKAAYHQTMKKVANRKVRSIERGVADVRVQKQIDKMTKMFADTPYADLIKK